MPNMRSARKALRSSERKRIRNRVYGSRSRTYVKRARRLIDTGQLEEAQEAARMAVGALDRAVQRGVIRKNNAARRKSRLMRMLNSALAQ